MAVAVARDTKGQARSKPHVLIVEDDPAVAKLIKNYLDREGHSVAVVETVADMRKSVESSKIDLIILDVGLPDEDGWAALRWLRARRLTASTFALPR